MWFGCPSRVESAKWLWRTFPRHFSVLGLNAKSRLTSAAKTQSRCESKRYLTYGEEGEEMQS